MNDFTPENSRSGAGLRNAVIVSFAIMAGGKIGFEKPEASSCRTINQDIDGQE